MMFMTAIKSDIGKQDMFAGYRRDRTGANFEKNRASRGKKTVDCHACELVRYQVENVRTQHPTWFVPQSKPLERKVIPVMYWESWIWYCKSIGID